MSDKITIHRSPAQGITLTHSRAAAGVQLLFQIGFFVVWYWLLLGQPHKSWVHVLFLIFPVLCISPSLWLLRASQGLTYSFDASTRTIKQNADRIASFEEVARLQIRTIYGGDSEDEYRLALVLHGDKKIRLAQTTTEEQVMHAADEIADLLGVTVHRK
jgi:hypothetical protein